MTCRVVCGKKLCYLNMWQRILSFYMQFKYLIIKHLLEFHFNEFKCFDVYPNRYIFICEYLWKLLLEKGLSDGYRILIQTVFLKYNVSFYIWLQEIFRISSGITWMYMLNSLFHLLFLCAQIYPDSSISILRWLTNGYLLKANISICVDTTQSALSIRELIISQNIYDHL